jgi:hypothetical protein
MDWAQGSNTLGYPFLSRTIIVNGTTSYTPPANVKALDVEGVGGGGGGGGTTTAAASAAAGGGGGGGAYAKSFIITIPASPITVAVGAGGSAGAATGANGGTGGDTSFNSGAVLAEGGL